MAEDRSFAELLARLRAGDADAADRIFRHYAGPLTPLARSRLDTVMRHNARTSRFEV
jgi:hypothetical protein